MSTRPRPNQRTPVDREFTRRTLNRASLGAGMIAALLAPGHLRAAQADSTPVSAGRTTEPSPTRYTLSGDHTDIVFTPSDGAHPPRLEYRDEIGSVTFDGEQLDLSDHPALGPVVSVMLRAAPDAFVEYLALPLPAVNLPPSGTDVPIETVAVLIRHLTSIGGPPLVSGQLQTYDVRQLSGTAEFEPA